MPHPTRFVILVNKTKENVQEITLENYLKQTNAWHLIDVREDHEWAQGAIPQALHIGKGVLERDIAQHYPEPNTPLLLYCGGGYRSILAAQALLNMGYLHVFSLADGFRGWRNHQAQIQTT